MRHLAYPLAFVVAVHLFGANPASSAQLFDRGKTKNGRAVTSETNSPSQRLVPQPVGKSTTGYVPADVRPTGSPRKTLEEKTSDANPAAVTPAPNSTMPNSAARTAPKAATIKSVTPTITIETQGPSEINLGRRASFTIHVRNDGSSIAHELVIEATLPPGADLLNAEPKPDLSDNVMLYTLNDLAPKAERQIEFEIIPRQPGVMDFRTRATVSTTATAPFQVRRPELIVKLTGPADTVCGEVISFKALITNTGDGIAEDLSVAQMLPATSTDAGVAPVAATFEQAAAISQLLPGQSQEIELPAMAEAEGTMRAQILVRASDGLEVKAVADVRVHRPSVEVTVMGPSARPVQRAGGYVVFVANTGDIAVSNIVVTATIPDGLALAAIQKGCTFDKKTNRITWKINTLDANATETMKFQAKALSEGKHELLITVIGDHATSAETSYVTQVTGKAELAMTIDDLAGPLEVGTQTEYSIRIKNCGTKTAENIQVQATIPAGIGIVESEGVTAVGKSVDLPPIEELAVGQEITLSLKTVGTAPGDHVIKFNLQCSALAAELSTETSTLYYAPKK